VAFSRPENGVATAAQRVASDADAMSAADDSDDESQQSECPSMSSDLSIELLEDGELAVFDELSGLIQPLPAEDEPADDVDDEQWRAAPFSGKVQLHYDDVDETLMDKMKSQVKLISHNVDNCEKNFHEDDHSRMTDNVKLYNCFAGNDFYHKLFEIANKNRPENEKAVTMREVELTLRLLFALGVCRSSLSFVLSNLDLFPLVSKIVDESRCCG